MAKRKISAAVRKRVRESVIMEAQCFYDALTQRFEELREFEKVQIDDYTDGTAELTQDGQIICISPEELDSVIKRLEEIRERGAKRAKKRSKR